MAVTTEQEARKDRRLRRSSYLACLGFLAGACLSWSCERSSAGELDEHDVGRERGQAVNEPAYYADGSEWEAVVPFTPPSIPLTSMNPRQQAEFFAQQGIQAVGPNGVRTFTPTWTGFAIPPVGDLTYIDFGDYVMLWNDNSFALTGTSNSGAMAISNLPATITPGVPVGVPTSVRDTTNTVAGLASIGAGGNNIAFVKAQVSGADIVYTAGMFTAVGTKGVESGWLVIYPK